MWYWQPWQKQCIKPALFSPIICTVNKLLLTVWIIAQLHLYRPTGWANNIRYDTIRYDTVDLRALKSWGDGQLNLAHSPETKNNGKNENQKPCSSEETVRQKSVEAVREEEEKLRGVGFVKEIGFKPGVKERWSYRCTKWWIRQGRRGGWRNRWEADGGTGARMRFTKRQRKLIPETRWSITEEAISYF